MITFMLTYILSLSSNSSYNNPRQFPTKLMPTGVDPFDPADYRVAVYPNDDNYWFGIPQGMNLFWYYEGK